jgi:hypothetical protein
VDDHADRRGPVVPSPGVDALSHLGRSVEACQHPQQGITALGGAWKALPSPPIER